MYWLPAIKYPFLQPKIAYATKNIDKMKTKIFPAVLVALCLLCLAACNKSNDTQGNLLTDVDVSAYDQWVYLSFESGVPRALNVEKDEPAQWDIALHRGDVKTNKGAALKSNATSLSALSELPADEFTPDITDSIAVDMSGMMQGIVIYKESEINPVLSSWVSRSGMPPVYTVSKNVYVVRTQEGKYAKLKFSSFTSSDDKSGFATFSYVYPAFE